MAVIRRGEKKGVPQLATSSLPDIIFMLLFFFMITTTMRETELKVQFTLPDATEIQKLEKKSLTSYIYVGPPMRQLVASMGNRPRIQLNDSFRETWEIGQFIASERDKLSERDRPYMSTTLKADKGIHMGMITDIKQELRKANANKLIYAANKTFGYED